MAARTEAARSAERSVARSHGIPRGGGAHGADPRRTPALVRRVALLLALVPIVRIGAAVVLDGLGADPIERLTHLTGWWALALLLGSLAVTPAIRITGWGALIHARRTLGLGAFGYAVLHVLVYAVDREFVPAYIVEDVVERPFITAGFAAFVLLVPLAVTSSRAAIRRLGGRRWNRLHRLVYPAAILAVVHFLWLVKADLREPLIFAVILGLLLAARLMPRRARSR
jgi:methionine sulfoxide reductase heme-binding subunit